MKKISSTSEAGLAVVTVLPTPQDTALDILKELDLKPYQAVLVVVGAANNLQEKLVPKLTQLFSRGVARAAQQAGAIIVDGGTQAGVMALMGQGVASQGHQSTLLGVAPAGLVSYVGGPAAGTALEPNHTHLVLTEGTKWGCETSLLYQLVAALTARGGVGPQPSPLTTPAGNVPVLVLLAGGGAVAGDEIVRAVRQRLPILVLAGSGGLADELAAAWPMRDTPPEDDRLAEILTDGTLRFYPVSESVTGLERLLVRELGADHTLLQAWETFADYDSNANRQQRSFDRLQQAIIVLGLLGTALAIGQQLYAPKEPGTSTLATPAVSALQTPSQVGWWLLHHALILLPIGLTVLVTATSRFKQGTKWLLLRAGAEAIKREIYRYRVRAMYYTENAEAQLAQRVEEITRRTMRTEVNTSSLVPYDKRQGFPPSMGTATTNDDGLGFLTPAHYVEVRLGNQLAYFRQKAVRLEKQLRILSWLTFLVGGLGTYLAAVGQQVWIALTTALAAAMGTYLGYRQTENTLTKYNQAATDLSNVRAWWQALTLEQQAQQANLDLLVTHTEQVLQSELDGWVQQMQNALAELHKNQPPASAQQESKAPAQAPELATEATAPAQPETSPGPAEANASEEAPTAEAEPDAGEEALTAEAELPAEDTTAQDLPEDAPATTTEATPMEATSASPKV